MTLALMFQKNYSPIQMKGVYLCCKEGTGNTVVPS